MKRRTVTKPKTAAALATVVMACAVCGCSAVADVPSYPSAGTVSQAVSTPPARQTAGNYQVERDPDNTIQPGADSLPMQDAARRGADQIAALYGETLEGKTIRMTYVGSTGPGDSPMWNGWIGDERHRGSQKDTQTEIHYSFGVDAKTGVVQNAWRSRVFGREMDTREDPALKQDYSQYQTLAKTFVQEHRLFSGSFQSAGYLTQGKTNNDPTLALLLTSDSGEKAVLVFSRYDQSVIGFYIPE